MVWLCRLILPPTLCMWMCAHCMTCVLSFSMDGDLVIVCKYVVTFLLYSLLPFLLLPLPTHTMCTSHNCPLLTLPFSPPHPYTNLLQLLTCASLPPITPLPSLPSHYSPPSLSSWYSLHQVVWYWGRLQCVSDGVAGPQSRGPLQFLQSQILPQDCTSIGWPAGM